MKRSSFSTVALQIAICILCFAMLQCNSTPSENTAETPVAEPRTTAETTTTQLDSPAIAETTVTTPEAAQPAPQPAPAAKTQPATAVTKPKDSQPVATKPTAQKAPSKSSTQKAKPVDTPPSKPAAAASPSAPPVVTKTETAPPPPPPAPKAEKAPAPSGPVTSSSSVSYKSVKGNIHGTSSLHEWDSKITKIACTGTLQTKDNVPTALKDMEIKIDVKGIKSKEGKKMDDKTFETFKSDKNPYITFSFDNAPIKMGASDAVTIEATGNLSMAGTTKSVTLTATGKLLPNGDLQLSTSKKIKMTEYNMTPPEMMLGTIKVGNEVTVSFDFVLEKG